MISEVTCYSSKELPTDHKVYTVLDLKIETISVGGQFAVLNKYLVESEGGCYFQPDFETAKKIRLAIFTYDWGNNENLNLEICLQVDGSEEIFYLSISKEVYFKISQQKY